LKITSFMKYFKKGVLKYFKIYMNFLKYFKVKYFIVHLYLDLRRYFFSERTVDRWNNVSQQDISCSTVNSFKNCLNRIRRTKMGFFMD